MSDPTKIVVNNPQSTKPNTNTTPIVPLGLNVLTHSLDNGSIESRVRAVETGNSKQTVETKKP